MFWESFFTLCTDRGVSPSQVSAELNLSSGAITKWKNGASPRPATIRKLADYFAVPVEYLLGTLPDTVRPVEMKKVPILGQIACGRPIFADEERGEYADAPVDVKADLCLTVKGDSMEGAGIRDGDLVFIRKQLTVDNGDIAAVIINDEATLKRWYYYPEEQKLVLRPENPAYDPIVLAGKDMASAYCLGRAVCVMRDRFYKDIENAPTPKTEVERKAIELLGAIPVEAREHALEILQAALKMAGILP